MPHSAESKALDLSSFNTSQSKRTCENINTNDQNKKLPPPSSPPPKSAVSNYRAKSSVPPPAKPPGKQASSATSQWRKANATSKGDSQGVDTNNGRTLQDEKRSESLMPTAAEEKTQLPRRNIVSVDYSRDGTSKSDAGSLSSLVGRNDALNDQNNDSGPVTVSKIRAVPLSGSQHSMRENTGGLELNIVKAERKTKPVRSKTNDQASSTGDHGFEVDDVEDILELQLHEHKIDENEEEFNEEHNEDVLAESDDDESKGIPKGKKKVGMSFKPEIEHKESDVKESGEITETQNEVEGGEEEELTESEGRPQQVEEERVYRSTRKDNSVSPKKGKKEPKVQLFHPRNLPYKHDDLKEFVSTPLKVGRGHVVRCFIERTGSTSKSLSPLYTMLIEVNSSSGRPIMYARKKPSGRMQSHYVISLNQEDLNLPRENRSSQYLGKLRSHNYLNYTLYDDKAGPEECKANKHRDTDDSKVGDLRSELAFILYKKSKKNSARNMQIGLPSVSKRTSCYTKWRAMKSEDSLESKFIEVTDMGGENVLDHENMVCLHKRETKYDALSSCIVDFKSRATIASVKNFQIIHSNPQVKQNMAAYEENYPQHIFDDGGTSSVPQEHVLLQMGKVGQDCFNVDFQHPICMLQAFAVCLSRFDTKAK